MTNLKHVSFDPDSWKLVPVEPTEQQWSGLARHIVMWAKTSGTGAELYKHLKLAGVLIPDWLRVEIRDVEHVPAKGDVAVAIYRAMLESAPSPPQGQEDEARAALAAIPQSAPLDMILFCPNCHSQHVDVPEPERGWTNPPHRSHLCHSCGTVWRPADVPTNGVREIKTKGEKDAAIPQGGGWRTVAEKPARPISVEYYFAKLPFTDQHGNPVEFEPYRDERRELGFWDGVSWCENGTGHDVFEPWRTPEQLPTHWRPLPPPPQGSET